MRRSLWVNVTLGETQKHWSREQLQPAASHFAVAPLQRCTEVLCGIYVVSRDADFGRSDRRIGISSRLGELFTPAKLEIFEAPELCCFRGVSQPRKLIRLSALPTADRSKENMNNQQRLVSEPWSLVTHRRRRSSQIILGFFSCRRTQVNVLSHHRSTLWPSGKCVLLLTKWKPVKITQDSTLNYIQKQSSVNGYNNDNNIVEAGENMRQNTWQTWQYREEVQVQLKGVTVKETRVLTVTLRKNTPTFSWLKRIIVN